MKILLTGRTGRLGRELMKLRTFDFAPTREEMDLRDPDHVSEYIAPRPIELIVHCAAYTHVERAESEKQECYETNVLGTRRLADFGIPILYISTEYVFDGQAGDYREDDYPNPVNFYALTKLLGEGALNARSHILRLVFKARPWPYPAAFSDQYTSGDYVDVMANEVNKVIGLLVHRRPVPRVLHLGTGRKTIYDLARQSRDVQDTTRFRSLVALPYDTSLDTTLWERIQAENTP